MSHTFSAQFWVAYKIWFIALLMNTVSGTIYLSASTHFSAHWNAMPEIAMIGFLYGLLFSFPVPFLLSLCIYDAFRKGFNPRQVFYGLLLLCVALTASCYTLFQYFADPGITINRQGLFFVATGSAITGVISQYRIFYGHPPQKEERNHSLTKLKNIQHSTQN